MRALRWHGQRDVRLDEVDEPPAPGPDEVTVEVQWCGICGTDLEEYTHGPLLIPTAPHPLTGAQAPLTLGHEVSARVLVAGSMSPLHPGQLVALDGYYFCGTCAGCRRQEVNLCDDWGHIGLSAPGGLTERMTVPSRMAVPATSDVAPDVLALAEPFSVAVRAMRRSGVATGMRVAVLGAGAIGLAVLQVALARGAREVVVVDLAGHRRAVASTLGAAATAAAVHEVGGPFDVVVECTGSDDVAAAGLGLVRRGGCLAAVGIPRGDVSLDLRRVVLDEITVVGSIGHVWDQDVTEAVRLICERRVDAEALITHRLPLERAADEGFALLATRDVPVLKVLVSPLLA